MLPDFPELKQSVMQEASAKIRKLIHRDHPILAEIKTRTQHEGRSMRYEQVGYGEKQEDLTHHSFPIEVKFDEVPTLIGEKLDEKLEGLARAVGEHQMKMFIAKHEETTEMTGNRIDAGGRPMGRRVVAGLHRIDARRLRQPWKYPAHKQMADAPEHDGHVQSCYPRDRE